MQIEIESLKAHFGSYPEVARQIGITDRHLLNLRKGMKPGNPLGKLIKELAAKANQRKGDHGNNSDPSNDI